MNFPKARWRMMPLIVFVAAALVQLMGPSGRLLYVNPNEVSSLRTPDHPGENWTAGTKCIVVMGNGRFNAVGDDCDTVNKIISSGRRSAGAPCALVCGSNER